MQHLELPPHTRRRVNWKPSRHYQGGTTSAYAEKRVSSCSTRLWSRNYLRIRGEERGLAVSRYADPELPPHTRRRETLPRILPTSRFELPPHTRRRVERVGEQLQQIGTTSAYAEKRLTPLVCVTPTGNYLRIRGEEIVNDVQKPGVGELPPHTRRRGYP